MMHPVKTASGHCAARRLTRLRSLIVFSVRTAKGAVLPVLQRDSDLHGRGQQAHNPQQVPVVLRQQTELLIFD